MPREVVDACHDLPEQGLCQVAFGELRGEVPDVPDAVRAGLVRVPLLEERQMQVGADVAEGEVSVEVPFRKNYVLAPPVRLPGPDRLPGG